MAAGCTSTGPVPIGNDAYMIANSSAGGAFVSGGSVKAGLLREGADFCAKSGKGFELISGKSQDAVVASSMPSAEINFRCVAK